MVDTLLSRLIFVVVVVVLSFYGSIMTCNATTLIGYFSTEEIHQIDGLAEAAFSPDSKEGGMWAQNL